MKKTIQEINKEQNMIRSIDFNMQLLSYRLNKLKSIDVADKNNQFEFLTYFDASLVSIRALLLENDKNSFSLVNHFIKSNQEDEVKSLNKLLDAPFDAQNEEYLESYEECKKHSSLEKIGEEKKDCEEILKSCMTLRQALKFISDKFICHHDNNTPLKFGKANYIMSILSNKNNKHYIGSIVENVSTIYKSSILKALKNNS